MDAGAGPPEFPGEKSLRERWQQEADKTQLSPLARRAQVKEAVGADKCEKGEEQIGDRAVCDKEGDKAARLEAIQQDA